MIGSRILFDLGIGLMMLSIGGSTLMNGGWRNGVPALELVSLRLLGRAPTPRTRWDRRIALFNACACTVLGALFTFGGLALALTGSAE